MIKTDTSRPASTWRSAAKALLLTLAISMMLMMFLPHAAYADNTCTPGDIAPGTCTTSCQFQVAAIKPGTGLISQITTNIQTLLAGVAQTMYGNIINPTTSGFTYAVNAAVTLYIAIYGILFTFGMVQVTLYEFAMRMIKIGIIVLLLSANSWSFFDTNVVTFFNQGTDDIINTVTKVTSQDFSAPELSNGLWGSNGSPENDSGGTSNNSYPFSELDNAVAYAFSAKAAVTIMGVFATGPYGVPIGLLLLMAFGSFIKSLMNALWVYLMSLVIKTLLFGLAPIFIACLLFSRTKHIFDGWLNQLVNASLQPILLFTFFAFYLNLIYACLINIVGPGSPPLCFLPYTVGTGTNGTDYFWQFQVADPATGVMGANPKGWDFTTSFPIALLSVLVFLILAELAQKFNDVIIQIAQDISGAVTGLAAGSEGLASTFASSSSRSGGSSTGAGASKPTTRTPSGGGGGGGGGSGGSGVKPGEGVPSDGGMNPAERARRDTPGPAGGG